MLAVSVVENGDLMVLNYLPESIARSLYHLGSTDAVLGVFNWNYKLGEERAEAVRRYLNQHGVALNRIGTISYGADAPVAPNTTRDGRKQNRRVVLIVLT